MCEAKMSIFLKNSIINATKPRKLCDNRVEKSFKYEINTCQCKIHTKKLRLKNICEGKIVIIVDVSRFCSQKFLRLSNFCVCFDCYFCVKERSFLRNFTRKNSHNVNKQKKIVRVEPQSERN